MPRVLAPLTAIAYGLVVYQVIVRRMQRGVPGFGLLANVILIVNLVLALPGYFFLTIITRVLPVPYDAVYYILPVGLLWGRYQDRYELENPALVGLAVFAGLVLLLLPSLWRAWRDAGRAKRGGDGI
ncbi:MAG: hypothetical protein LUE17_18010 [Planctomycetaceae bacterium]|nr:hypothetical protein [Planctomycetaceae bacterium]